jgi:hypothetical protein
MEDQKDARMPYSNFLREMGNELHFHSFTGHAGKHWNGVRTPFELVAHLRQAFLAGMQSADLLTPEQKAEELGDLLAEFKVKDERPVLEYKNRDPTQTWVAAVVVNTSTEPHSIVETLKPVDIANSKHRTLGQSCTFFTVNGMHDRYHVIKVENLGDSLKLKPSELEPHGSLVSEL